MTYSQTVYDYLEGGMDGLLVSFGDGCDAVDLVFGELCRRSYTLQLKLQRGGEIDVVGTGFERGDDGYLHFRYRPILGPGRYGETTTVPFADILSIHIY